VQIQGRVTWEIHENRATGHWTGVCRELNIVASGENFDDFKAAAEDSMSLLFRTLFRTGEMGGFLREQGWRPATELPPASTRRVEFSVPYLIHERNRIEELVPVNAWMISREQLIRRLRQARWEYEDQSKRAEIWKKIGGKKRLIIPHRDYHEIQDVKVILRTAGLTPDELEKFLMAATKESPPEV